MPDTIDMSEFEDLVKALEEDRPQIDPSFARILDRRAADGFAKPPWHARLPSLTWLGLPAAAVASLVLIVAVVGGSSGPGDDSSSGAGGASSSVAAAPQQELSGSKAARDSAASAAVPAASQPLLRGRVQEQTAGLTLIAPGKQLAEVGDRVIAVTDQVGGFVVSSSVSTTSGGDYQLRVPVARLDDALGRLSKLGHVSERTQGSQDITAERNVARDRFDEAVAERRSLLNRLAKATTDNQVASLKARLGDVNAAIASNRAALERVLRRARYASLRVSLQAKRGGVIPVDDGTWTPGDAVRDAGRVLEVAAGVVVVAGSVLLPLALLALLGVAASRVAGRRGRDRMLESV